MSFGHRFGLTVNWGTHDIRNAIWLKTQHMALAMSCGNKNLAHMAVAMLSLLAQHYEYRPSLI
ncbi:hypothetical protein FRX31_023435 [Thalictrum thalictroides]|uniref:Uncharacterized protein n=1 Tax=Thalictrum thalictroides TaxID=46969 RepID=A0A7J6VQW2_THATH|nr:hypothetical protein FRX31_023435 [Thalictrum thalictroides]